MLAVFAKEKIAMNHERKVLSELATRISQQSEKKDRWKENDGPYEIAKMILGEAQELVEAIEKDGEAFEVGSEIGDVFYLTLRLAEYLGINLYDVLVMKETRNDLKYPTNLNSNGRDYESSIKISKELWAALGGDEGFSNAWMLFGEDIVEGETVVFKQE